MNRISKEKEVALVKALRQGLSLRKAAEIAGVSKHTANVARLRLGGMPGLREQGISFKINRWK